MIQKRVDERIRCTASAVIVGGLSRRLHTLHRPLEVPDLLLTAPAYDYAQKTHLAVHVNVAQSVALPPLLVDHLADGVNGRRLAQLLQVTSAIRVRDCGELLDAVPLSQRRVFQNQAKNRRSLPLVLHITQHPVSHGQIHQERAGQTTEERLVNIPRTVPIPHENHRALRGTHHHDSVLVVHVFGQHTVPQLEELGLHLRIRFLIVVTARTQEDIHLVDEEDARSQLATHRKQGADELLTLSEVHVHQRRSTSHDGTERSQLQVDERNAGFLRQRLRQHRLSRAGRSYASVGSQSHTVEKHALRKGEERLRSEQLRLAQRKDDHVLQLLLDIVDASNVVKARVDIVGIDHILHHNRFVLERHCQCLASHTLLAISKTFPVLSSNFFCQLEYCFLAASTSFVSCHTRYGYLLAHIERINHLLCQVRGQCASRDGDHGRHD